MQKYWVRGFVACIASMMVLIAAGALSAQEPSVPPNSPEQRESGNPSRHANGEIRLEDLTKQLNLTATQKKKIRPLLKEEYKRVKQVQSNTSLSEGQVKRRIATIRRSTHERIAEVLTPEQKEKWQGTRQQQRAAGSKEGIPPGAEGAP